MRKVCFAFFLAVLPLMPSVVYCQSSNQRFTLVRGEKGSYDEFAYAFDTKTGQMCKAWDWDMVVDAGSKNNGVPSSVVLISKKYTVEGTHRLVDMKGYPTCLTLFLKYPDGADRGPREHGARTAK